MNYLCHGVTFRCSYGSGPDDPWRDGCVDVLWQEKGLRFIVDSRNAGGYCQEGGSEGKAAGCGLDLRPWFCDKNNQLIKKLQAWITRKKCLERLGEISQFHSYRSSMAFLSIPYYYCFFFPPFIEILNH